MDNKPHTPSKFGAILLSVVALVDAGIRDFKRFETR